MACKTCRALPEPPKRQSYFVQLSNEAGESFDCIVQTTCPHDLPQWIEEHSAKFPIVHPRVINVDAKIAAHVPTVDRVN